MGSFRTIIAALVALIVLLLSTQGTGEANVASASNISAEVQTPPPAQVSALKITILSTMLADAGIGEWGFSALVEAGERRVDDPAAGIDENKSGGAFARARGQRNFL
jgi:hypothetical protein